MSADAWVECPECGVGCEGGRFGDDAWCPECGRVWETDWDYTDVESGSMAAWCVGEKGRMTRVQWEEHGHQPESLHNSRVPAAHPDKYTEES